MKLEFNKRYTTIAIYAFLVLAGAILFYGLVQSIPTLKNFLSTIKGLLSPFAYAFGIAYILNPVLKTIEKKIVNRVFSKKMGEKGKRGIALLITYLFAFGLITIFTMIVVPQLISSISSLVYQLTQVVNSADKWLPTLLGFFPEFDLTSTVIDTVKQYAQTIISAASQLVPWMVSFSTRIASGFLDIVVGLIISVYMLLDKERFYAGTKKVLYAVLPNKNANWMLSLTADANKVFGGFISGKILDSLIIGILCFICTWLMRMPNAMLVSVIVGVTNVIPYFGPFIGAIPSFLIILIDSPVKSLWFLIFILVLQQFDGNILGPKILGDSTGLSAFWVIFAIMLFGGLYGFLGMFLGVPVFSVIYMLVIRLVNARLSVRDMPTDINAYCAPDAHIPQPSPRRKKKDKLKKLKVPFVHKVGPLGKKQEEKKDDQ